MGVRINWKHILAFVPIANEGNVYFGGKCIFGHDYLGNLPCMKRISTTIIKYIYAFLMEIMVVRIKWKHILAIVPM